MVSRRLIGAHLALKHNELILSFQLETNDSSSHERPCERRVLDDDDRLILISHGLSSWQ